MARHPFCYLIDKNNNMKWFYLEVGDVIDKQLDYQASINLQHIYVSA